MDAGGANPVRLTFNNSTDYTPKYSPDGTKIVFWSKPSTSGTGNLWIMNNDGSNLRQLTTEGVDVSFGLPFSWSSDGSAIVYTYYRPDERSYRNGTLWIVDIDSGEKRQLTFNHSSSN
jgi:Tol biopolymer transport system component